MDDSGLVRFPGNLDPCAREFFPTNPFGSLLPPLQQQVYFPYPPYHRSAEGVGYPPLAPPPLQTPYLPPPSHTPTRALLISMVSPDASESLVRRELEVFGDVRAVQMERVREGIVTVHFYDLRHAQAALVEIQQQHMQQQYRLRRHYESVIAHNFLPPPPAPLPAAAAGLIAGRAVWAQFTIPASYGVADGNNQGSLVIFNLDPRVSPSHLKDIFETFGTVKELRETPMKRHQRFVEFYDVRDAAKALSEMNHKEINSNKILIQYSRPGGCASKPIPKFHTKPSTRFSQPPPFQRRRSAAVTSWSSKKPNQSKGHPGGSIQDSMDSLSISSWNNNNNNNHGFKKGTDGSSSSSSSSYGGGKTNRRRTWKGQGGNNVVKQLAKDHDPRFLINEDAIMESQCRDSRTTVMIKNIPNKYSNKCNVGYGFVNMTSPQATWRLYKAFHQQTWEVFNSRKVCEVTYARLQGLEALKEHFKNSKFPCEAEAEEYMPVVFSPPRDGKALTHPVPIVGRQLLLTSKEDEGEGEEEEESNVEKMGYGGAGAGDCGDLEDNDDDDDG
ncbi:PREDICTED: protein terminal ear1 homolog isoform X2 [Ipomoea nil]|uniref:protein terminal ear1 homolog isoform X2 n=1 Tax=Ipomoea nil TaxID=35883 RepID=UPI000901750B|nr:PREDICTED: protein terminal ear1 homolog isoform X2 [Ipomoea nil]